MLCHEQDKTSAMAHESHVLGHSKESTDASCLANGRSVWRPAALQSHRLASSNRVARTQPRPMLCRRKVRQGTTTRHTSTEAVEEDDRATFQKLRIPIPALSRVGRLRLEES
jgi:hypothetical protein